MAKTESRLITNKQLQRYISERLEEMRNPEADTASARVFYNGAKTLLTSVKIDIEASKFLGKPMFKRTKEFLEVSDEFE